MQNKYTKLREPLKACDIEIRIGNVTQKGASLLLYKTARIDSKRLDDVFGGRWKRKHYVDGKGSIVCEVSIYDDELKEWISREDVGSESNTEKEKGAYSDSFKRACFSWGIGVELYDAPFIFIPSETIKRDGGRGYDLANRFLFNDAILSNFYVDNDQVYVEIKIKQNIIFSNFKDNIQKTKDKFEFDFENLKTILLESQNLKELAERFTIVNVSKKYMTADQLTELTNIKENLKKSFV